MVYSGDEWLPEDVTTLAPPQIVYTTARVCFICGQPGDPEVPVTWIKQVRQWWCALCEEILDDTD